MKFSYETQGAITYLVCELDKTEQIDNLTLGMLTNNHIAGLAPVLYTEMDGQQFLKYNISAKVTSEQFFGGNINKERALKTFKSILDALCSADEYMIEQSCFSLLPEHVFLNVSNCETALICVPAIIEKDINTELKNFFKKVMFSTQFDPSESTDYITQLITYINSEPNFNSYGLKDLVEKLQSGTCTPTPAPTPVPAAPAAPVNKTPQQTSVPVSNFNATISIDDMPAMMAAKQNSAVQQAPAAQNVKPQPPIPPVAPTPVPTPKPSTPPAFKPVNNIPPINNDGRGVPIKTPPKPPIQNNAGFAIPGQPCIPQKPQTPPPAQPKAVVNQPEKKKSLFGLFSKKNDKPQPQKNQNMQIPKPSGAPSVPPAPINPIPVQPEYRPPVQPVPVQNSFNETTVLSPAMMGGGETTVLGSVGPNPCLLRTKNGERIQINKPVFRIGKEKSYVDYFVADNTAISRSHANIHTQNGEYFIEDTNSTNHTYVNEVIIASNVKVKLKNGDKIKLANEDFTFTV